MSTLIGCLVDVRPKWGPGPGVNAEVVLSRFHVREAGSGTLGPFPQ